MQEVLSLSLTGLRRYLGRRAWMRSKVGRSPNHTMVPVTLRGRSIMVDQGDIEQFYLLTDCVREPENVFMYRALARSGLCRIFVDVGANYGHVALKVVDSYDRLVLVDANPHAAGFLRKLFAEDPNVSVHNVALVDGSDQKTVVLSVPENSSGLGSLNAQIAAGESVRQFEVQATTLDLLLHDMTNTPAYVKIDVEGLEDKVIAGGMNLRRRDNIIFGFEALSREAAARCCDHFADHAFYFARFDFLNPTGALTKSMGGLLRAVAFGGSIRLYRFHGINDLTIDNFSQIIAVPRVLQASFERAMHAYASKQGNRIDLLGSSSQ